MTAANNETTHITSLHNRKQTHSSTKQNYAKNSLPLDTVTTAINADSLMDHTKWSGYPPANISERKDAPSTGITAPAPMEPDANSAIVMWRMKQLVI